MPSGKPLIRRAQVKDVNAITELINYYAKQGDMLSRSICRSTARCATTMWPYVMGAW